MELMELSLVRSLMNKDFYENNRGARCPDKLFSADVRKIKKAVDIAMDRYDRTVTPEEVQALFISSNPSITPAQRESFNSLFNNIQRTDPLGNDVAGEVLSRLFQQVVGAEIAELGFDYVNGDKASLEPLQQLLEKYGEDFTPKLNIEWDDISIDTIIAKNDLEARWTFNIPALTRKVCLLYTSPSPRDS